jgi:hypothetical protein
LREKKYLYEIQGNVTCIYSRYKDIKLTIIIDTADLDMVLNYRFKWVPYYSKNSKNYYVRSLYIRDVVDGKTKYGSIKLARTIMNAQKGDVVDHKNHNTLDNRKINLRVTNTAKNTKHRKSKNSNNTSGYRNVSKIKNEWVVQMQVNGKNTQLKKFPLDQLDEAGVYAAEMRQLYYGKFAGES